MRKVKIKFFFIGFISSILIVSMIIFGLLKYLESKRINEFTDENKKEIENFQYSIIDLEKSEIEKISLTNPNNNIKYNLKDKKIIFLNFWATWCLPCITEMPSIKELSNDKNNFDKSIQYIMASEDSKEKILNFENKKQFNFDYAIFKKESLPKFIDHQSIPTTYIIDTKNLICYKIEGSMNYNSTLFKKFINIINNKQMKNEK